MEAKELRIGNWIYSNTDKDIYRVDLIESWRNYLSISAIPLTEEWLLRFGFTKESNYFKNYLVLPLYSSSFLLKVNLKTGIISTGGKDCLIEHSRYAHIKSVHQLQNLYFALTGLELEYGS